jgi:5'-3' exoribonuclease 2
MGVPALFRWLSRKYPKIISPVIEEDSTQEIGAAQYSDENPNGEIDNLYLDMNGIVHPCSHPEHKPAPETEDEMFLDVFAYTDRVLMMARPRKVLMIAVDGVAPRAKMNQQRARRFRSAQDAKIKDEERAREIRERELRGEMIDQSIKTKSWDSNAITPGTPFMDRLAEALRYWVAYKLSTDPGWADLQVIISDATVPGEGEHKLMSFIRSQRSDPQYNPNTRHCIYGLDADLIFLGLATHEPHFRVLREDVFANQSRSMSTRDQMNMTQEQRDAISEQDKRKPFLWLHVNVLREYLEIELYNPHLPFPFDRERAIDDWVFMCFFVGNDFLPHLPSLDVRDNGIDLLVNCWKRILPKLNDYLTCDGNLNLNGVEKLMGALAYKEDDIFRRRREQEVRREENSKRRKFQQEEEKALKAQYLSQVSKGSDKAPLQADVNMPLMTTSGELVEGYAQLSNKDIVHNRGTITKANMSNVDAANALKKLLDSKKSGSSISAVAAVQESQSESGTPVESEITSETASEKPNDSDIKRKRTANEENLDEEDEEDNNGDVKLWEAGYRQRYYQTKFQASTGEEIDQIRREVVRCYLEGISWVLLYYYQGCPSWNWYFPYHYAPFAADFTDIDSIVGEEGITFKLGEPFRPFEQLMSVLPAASGHNLPEVFRELMSHPESEIIDFYPEDFKIDMNGAKMSWQGIALLPFIDEKRLLTAVQDKYDRLTENEIDRNTNKEAVLIISPQNKNYGRFVESLYEKDKEFVEFKFAKSQLAGKVWMIEAFKLDGTMKFPLSQGSMPHIPNSDYFQVFYSMPPKKKGKSMLLNGYIPHAKVLTDIDRNNIMYGGPKNNQYGRFNAPSDNSEYVNRGPSGKELYLTYSMRRGGYRSFEYMENQIEHQPRQNQGGYNNYNNQYNNYNQGFNNHQNFNQGYNQNRYNNYNNNQHGNRYNNQNSNYNRPNNNYNQGYNNNYKQGYNNHNQGYNNHNQGYNNHNQGYNNHNQGYNNNYNSSNRDNYGGNYRGNPSRSGHGQPQNRNRNGYR